MYSPSHTGPSVMPSSVSGFVSSSNFQDICFSFIWGLQSVLVRFFDENESGSLHDRRARADERDVHVLHLAFSRASRRLQHAFDDVPETVDAPGAETPAEGVERQLAVQLDAPVLDEVEAFAFLAEPVGLEAVHHRRREAVVDLRHVDVLRTEPRALPGKPR